MYSCSNFSKLLICPWLFLIGSAASLQLKDLLDELSWTLKLRILRDVPGGSTTTSTIIPPTTRTTTTTTTTESTPLPVHDGERSDITKTRRVGMEFLVSAKRRQGEGPLPTITPDANEDENNMRLKLFKLMYETVRDSDLKVKRAELIQDRYTNETSFQIGYLMGDVTDKFGIMSDISTTLDRFYAEWKPIEHINAYEQIANQAIEVSHLIDLMRLAGKKDASTNLRNGNRVRP